MSVRSGRPAAMARALTVGTFLVALVGGCGGQSAPREEAAVSVKTIEEVLAAHTDSLMAMPGVVGTAIGVCDSVPCIRVFLADSSDAVRERIPTQLGGYRVRAEVTGPIWRRQRD